MKRLLYFIFFLFLIMLFLCYPAKCISYGENGLLLWFHRMLPTLFPFMVITGVLIRLNLTAFFPSANTYVTAVGFLCGFPLGAYTAAAMYQEGQISRKEAQYLISYTNNLGPVFFLSYILPAYHISNKIPFLIGMYGIPLLYGFLLRHTIYKDCTFAKLPKGQSCPLAAAIDASVSNSITAITKLGGYMILMQTLYILPELFMQLLEKHLFLSPQMQRLIPSVLCCLLEITGGVSSMTVYSPLWILLLLPIGGISCILQTGSIISQTDLSLAPYLVHKLLQTILSAFYYVALIALGFLPV